MLDIQQNTEEWLELRQGKIGASDAPIIMGVSPFKTPYQLWKEKIEGTKTEMTFPMIRGHMMEGDARECFIEQTGIFVEPKVLFHKDLDWMMASLDGMSVDGKTIVEIKCPGKKDHTLAQNGDLPEKYYPQLQHQIAVAGVDKAFYFSFDGEKGVLLEVERNDDYIEKLIVGELEFYECINNFIPPKMTERDAELECNSYVTREDDEWNDLALQYIICKERLELLKKEEESLRNDLIKIANEENCKGHGIKVTRYTKRGSISYSKIPELKDIDLEQYRGKATECYRVELT